MSTDNENDVWPEVAGTFRAFFEVIFTFTLTFIMGWFATIMSFVPFIGGWIASHIKTLAENAWGKYEEAVTDLGEPLIEVIHSYVGSYTIKFMPGLKNALWTLEAAVWRLQHIYIPQVIVYIFQTVNMEAATGYQSTAQDRKSAIEKAARDIVSDLPIIRSIVGRIVGIALDLIEIDQPELRILLGFVLKELVKHLGVQQAAGAALDSLIGPLLGEAPPRNLHDTIARLGADNNANAQWIANYGQPMVSDLAADERIGQVAIEGLAGALGLAGLVLMVRDPARAGTVMSHALKVGLPIMSAVSLGTGQPVQAAEFGFLAVMADDPFRWADALARIAR